MFIRESAKLPSIPTCQYLGITSGIQAVATEGAAQPNETEGPDTVTLDEAGAVDSTPILAVKKKRVRACLAPSFDL
jgi:hypothetical protein